MEYFGLAIGCIIGILASYSLNKTFRHILASHEMIMYRLDQLSLQVRKYDPDHQAIEKLVKECEKFQENQRKENDTTRI